MSLIMTLYVLCDLDVSPRYRRPTSELRHTSRYRLERYFRGKSLMHLQNLLVTLDGHTAIDAVRKKGKDL